MKLLKKIKEAVVGKKPSGYEMMMKEVERQLAKQSVTNPFLSPPMSGAYLKAAPAPKPKPLPVERTTTRPVGYRVWRLRDYGDGPVLVSTAHDFQWKGPVVSNEDPPPDRWGGGQNTPNRASWGFFAAKALVPIPRYPGVVVSGALDTFGSVVEHEKGYRAQGMRIRKLWLHPGGWAEHEEYNDPYTFTLQVWGSEPEEPTAPDFQVYSTSAPAPWYPYDTGPVDTVRALEDRYQCDVEFVRVPIGAVTTKQERMTWHLSGNGFKWVAMDEDQPNEPEPTPTQLATPTPEEIERYGNRRADPETGSRPERDGRTPALRTVRGADALRIATTARA